MSSPACVCDRPGQETKHWEKMAHNWPARSREKGDFFFVAAQWQIMCKCARGRVSGNVSRREVHAFLPCAAASILCHWSTHTHTDTHSWFLIFMALCFLGNFWSKHTSARRKGKVSRVSKCVSWNISSPQTPRTRHICMTNGVDHVFLTLSH